MIYVATAQAFDDEMSTKIAAHRKGRGAGWETVETPLDPAAALRGLPADRAVLVDCATMWLSNLMLNGMETEPAVDGFLAALAASPAQVTVVSNEVGQGIVPDNALARRFRDAQGRLIGSDQSMDAVLATGDGYTRKARTCYQPHCNRKRCPSADSQLEKVNTVFESFSSR